jgi:hypothetical protein
MTKAVWGARIRLAGVLTLIVLSSSCGDLTRQGTASSYLIVVTLEAASGANEGVFGNTLLSDVVTVVGGRATFFNDLGRVNFRLGMKDPGSSGAPTTPTPANWITVDRYHVRFIRADGRNTEGVDVPYAFDSAFTVTVSGDAQGGFTLVRHTAKLEAPLAALAGNGLIIDTIAEITFYGYDQTGREVSAVGKIGVSFANFGDPK